MPLYNLMKKIFSQKNSPEKLWVETGIEYGGTLRNFCKKNFGISSATSKTKAADRLIQSLKQIKAMGKSLISICSNLFLF